MFFNIYIPVLLKWCNRKKKNDGSTKSELGREKCIKNVLPLWRAIVVGVVKGVGVEVKELNVLDNCHLSQRSQQNVWKENG